jgi:hypothetical protein
LTDPAKEGNPCYVLAIGFTVMVAVYASGGISVGIYNLAALATGIILVDSIMGYNNAPYNLWNYLVG